MSYRQLLLAGSLLLPLANASEPEPALANTAESSVVTPSSAASSAIAPGATAGDNRQQLWLRPLGNIKSGDINQLQLDEHVLQYAPNGQVRVVDAQLQPLAGELRQLPPPLVQQALTIIALDEAAYSDIDNAVAEEAISVALQEQGEDDAGGAVQDGGHHLDLPTVDLQMGGKRTLWSRHSLRSLSRLGGQDRVGFTRTAQKSMQRPFFSQSP